jgi:hypothetical protein
LYLPLLGSGITLEVLGNRAVMVDWHALRNRPVNRLTDGNRMSGYNPVQTGTAMPAKPLVRYYRPGAVRAIINLPHRYHLYNTT